MEHETVTPNYQFPLSKKENNESLKALSTGLNLSLLVDRLRTFTNFRTSFNKANLAASGLYYVHTDKVVKCINCDIEIFDFTSDYLEHHECCGNTSIESGSDSIESGSDSDNVSEHYVHSENKNCIGESVQNANSVSVMGKRARDEWLDAIGMHTQEFPKYKHFSSYAARLKSFDGCPNRKLKFDKLSEAGFFYIGTEDRTVCFHCNGGLREWKETDDPWIEHAHWFPRCNYVLLAKGKEFIEEAWTKTRETTSPEEMENTTYALNKLIELIKSESKNQSKIPPKEVNKICASNMSGKFDPMCKICYMQERNIMFSPCHHIVACENCSAKLTKCAVCREDIKDTVRVFFS